jgi:hypothetical protein
MALLTMALSCIHKEDTLKNNQTITALLDQSAKTMMKSQKNDGSFGNSITTALVVQVKRFSFIIFLIIIFTFFHLIHVIQSRQEKNVFHGSM